MRKDQERPCCSQILALREPGGLGLIAASPTDGGRNGRVPAWSPSSSSCPPSPWSSEHLSFGLGVKLEGLLFSTSSQSSWKLVLLILVLAKS